METALLIVSVFILVVGVLGLLGPSGLRLVRMRAKQVDWPQRLYVLAAGCTVFGLGLTVFVLFIWDDTPDEPLPLVTGRAAERLAMTFSPVLYLARQEAACDSSIYTDPYDPVKVDVWFEQPDVRLMTSQSLRPDSVRKEGPVAADLYNLGDDQYLDILKDSHPRDRGDLCDYETAYGQVSDERAVYAMVLSADDRIALQYWFFYYFNDWTNRHEGDWEVIQLSFEASSIDEIFDASIEPEWVAYSQHTGGRRRRWDDVLREPAGDTHPVVFVGAGSHANYFEPGTWRAEIDAWFDGCDFAAAGAEARRLNAGDYNLLLMSDAETADDLFAWLTFDGNWGELSLFGFSGPTGPLRKSITSDPWKWNNSLSDRDNGRCVDRQAGQITDSGSGSLDHLEKLQATVTVGNGDIAVFLITWGGSEVSLTLESPSGELFDPDASDGNVTHEKGENHEVYRIIGAEPGEWTMVIEGTDLPDGPDLVTWEAIDIPPTCAAAEDADPSSDSDLDGVPNSVEESIGTDPCLWDTDGDGVSDVPVVPTVPQPTATPRFRGTQEPVEDWPGK